MLSKLDILVNLLRKGIKPDPSLIGRYGQPQYTDRSSGNVLGRSTEQPTYQQQLTKQPVNAAILNAVTGYGADIIESPVQTLAIDPAVAAVKTPAKTLQAFGDLTSARLQGVTGRPNQQKLESGLTSLAEAAGGAAEVVGVGLPLAKAGAKPLRASLDNVLSQNTNRLQTKPISISDEIAEQVGTADEVAPVVDDAVALRESDNLLKEQFQELELNAKAARSNYREALSTATPQQIKELENISNIASKKRDDFRLSPQYEDMRARNKQKVIDEYYKEKDPSEYRMSHQPRARDAESIQLDNLSVDVSGNKSGYPNDFYTPKGKRIYAPGPRFADDMSGISNDESYKAVLKAKNNPDAEITIYRGVPKYVDNINDGDFVTLSKTYAEEHASTGYGQMGDEAGKVISQKVKVKDILWPGDDINEFGYYPSKPQELMPTSAVDDAVDATQELMPPSRIADDPATTTPFANETTKSMQETYGYLQKQSGMKPKEFKEFLENARTDPESAEMLFNINNRFTVTARGLGAKPASEEIITRGIIKQSADQARRINKSFDAALGNPDTAFQTLKGIKSKIKSEASPLYNKAFSQEFVMTQGLQDVMSIPLLGKYEKSAVKRLKELKKPTGKLRVLHQVKRKLDGDIGKAIKSGDNTEASDLLQLKNDLLTEIDTASPKYKEARKIYANQKANENALSFGEKNIFSGKVNAEEFAEEIKDYSKSELESLRVGIKKAISKVEAGKPVTYNAVDKKFIIPNTRAKLEIAIGKDSADKLYQSVDAEAAMFRQSSSVAPLNNSRSLLNAEAIQQAELGLKNPLKIGIAKAGQAVVEANANPATLLGRGVSGIVKKGTDSVSASYNEQLAKAAADVLTRPANEGIEMLLAAAPQEKVGIARQIIAKTEGQPSTEVTLQANNVVDAADIINAPQKQGIDTLESVAPQEKVGIAREIISQTQGKPVTPLKRKAIEVLSAQALNPEMQNIARGLGGAGAVSATSSDEPNVLSNILAAPSAEGPKTATNIQDLPAGAVIYPNNYNKLKSGDIYYKKVNGAYVGYRKK